MSVSWSDSFPAEDDTMISGTFKYESQEHFLERLEAQRKSVARERKLRRKAEDARNECRLKSQELTAQLQKTQEELNFQKSITADLKETSELKEREMQEQIDRLKEQVATEAQLRQKAEDEHGMTLVKMKLEMSSQAAEGKRREDALREETEGLKRAMERFQQKEKKMEEEIKLLKEQLVSACRRRNEAENERDTICSNLMRENTSRAAEGKRREKAFRQKIASLKKAHNDEVAKNQDKDVEIEAFKNTVSTLSDNLKKVMEGADRKATHWEQEKQSILREMQELKQNLLDSKSENQTLSCNLQTQTEQKEEMALKMDQMEKYIAEIQENSVQAAKNWEKEKDCLLKEYHGHLTTSEANNQTLKAKIEKLQQTAEQEKAAHERALAELLEEKAAILKDVQELKTELRGKGNEVTFLHEMVTVLEKKKQRKWFRKLLG